MISNIFSFIVQEWHSATHDTYFKLIISIVIIFEVIRCISVIFVCVSAHLSSIIKDVREQMSEKWSLGINRMSRRSERKKKANQRKDITNKKGYCREGKEKTEKENAMSKKNETPQKEDIDANMTEQTIKRWAEGLLKYVPLLMFLSSIYIACMSCAIERYLKKYNIEYVNAQIPSKTQMINGILAACATMLIALWFAPYYQTLTKQGKRGLIQKFIIYVLGYTIVFIILFSVVAFSVSKGSGIVGIVSMFVSFIRKPSNIFAMFTCVFLLAMATGCYEWLIRKGKIIKLPHLLIIFAIIAMYAVMLLQIINKSESTLHTVHIQATDETKTWTKNTPIAEDGKQIWAVVHESKDFYFIEPLTIKPEESDEYTVDKDHHMALSKTGVIVYSKTVGDLNDEAKRNDRIRIFGN